MSVAELVEEPFVQKLADPGAEDDPEVGHGAQQDEDADKDEAADDDTGNDAEEDD